MYLIPGHYQVLLNYIVTYGDTLDKLNRHDNLVEYNRLPSEQ